MDLGNILCYSKDIDKYLDTFSENYLGLEDGALFDFND